ncbi:MAG: hypothetical protein ACRECO_16275 [Xanthobacteraceae bacterium]
MSTVALALLAILAVATLTFYVAGGISGHGSPWARDVCAFSGDLCRNPLWLAAATGGMAVVYLILRGLRF